MGLRESSLEIGPRLRLLRFDLANMLRYGPGAPRRFEQVLFRPRDCQRRLPERGWDRRWSGHVVGGDWDLTAVPLASHPTFQACRQHFQGGVPWEETGVYERLLQRIDEKGEPSDGCSTYEDVVRRYEAIDALFDQLHRERRLRSQAELSQELRRREHGGIRISVGRAGEPIFGRGGYHRLAIASILDLDIVPGVLHIVHPEALPLRRVRGPQGRAVLCATAPEGHEVATGSPESGGPAPWPEDEWGHR